MILIDKAALLNRIATEVHYDTEHPLEAYGKLLSEINDAPEDIVRCKDCAFWENKLTYRNRNGETWGDCLNLNKGPLTKGEFFCAWGERRNDAETN